MSCVILCGIKLEHGLQVSDVHIFPEEARTMRTVYYKLPGSWTGGKSAKCILV